jgi:hypothetical protein
MLDLGGGFPVRYDADPPPLAEYAAGTMSASVIGGGAAGRSAFNGYPAPGIRIMR